MKVLIVDDLQAMRTHATALVQQFLGAETEIVTTDSGVQAVSLDEQHSFDLIVLDVSMPDLSGIKVAESIWKKSPARKILFWSQYSREAHVRELGKIIPDDAIHGYVLKSETDAIFGYALQSIVTHGNPYISAQIRGIGNKMHSRDASFSDIEYATLLDLALGLTDKAIAKRHRISVRGAQNRISTLFAKLLEGEDSYYQELAGMEIFSPRTRAAYITFKRGLLDPDSIEALEADLQRWLTQEFE